MRIVAQRVTRASVTVSGEVISKIDRGICALVGVFTTDTLEIAENMATKLAKLRIFSEQTEEDGAEKRWEKCVMDTDGSILCVSQFTLCASLKKGSKPDFHAAMPGEDSRKVFAHFTDTLRKLMGNPDRVKEGKFGHRMMVDIANDGPVTIVIDSAAPVPEKPRRSGSNQAEGSGNKKKNTKAKQSEDKQLADECEQSLSCNQGSTQATPSETEPRV